MFSGKDAANPAYPTQWALNPTAYQNIDSSQVDWAALAQQWIAMKEAAVIVNAPPPPSTKPDIEEGEAPMEVENPDINQQDDPAEWNSAPNSWGGSWNQWGWGWPGSGPVDPKMVSDPTVGVPPIMDGYAVPPENSAPMPSYTTGAVPTPTFQHGYWTAPQVDSNSQDSNSRERRSKSKNRDPKAVRTQRPQRDKVPVIPPVLEPIVMPTPTIDAAKRRQLPAWIREGLEKMEREKQKAIEREQEKKAREEAEREKKKLEEEQLERMKAEASGQPMLPPKSKFDTDSEGEDSDKEEQSSAVPAVKEEASDEAHEEQELDREEPSLIKRSKEEIMQEVMLAVRRSLTEILLEVTDQEIHMVSQEELARYNAAQASRLNAMKASKSKALAAIASGLGLGAYESSSDESADEDQGDLSDQQLQDIIKRKRAEFERTSREIEAEVRRAELREAADESTTPVVTPDRPTRSRSSATPPPIDSETPEKIPERRPSKDKRSNHKLSDKVDRVRKLDTISEEKPKKSNRKENSPSSQTKTSNKVNHKDSSSTTTSDSEEDSSSSSDKSSSESEPEVKIESKQVKKHKRRSSSSSNSRKQSKKHKKEKSHKSDEKETYSKSKYHEDYERSEKSRSNKKKDDYYERHASSRSRDYERSHKDKYRDDSEEERPRKRTKRSRSISYESRSGRRKASRDRSGERYRRREKKSYDRDSSKRDRSYDRSGRDYDKYDRYERYRDYDRRRSRSGSRPRHRR